MSTKKKRDFLSFDNIPGAEIVALLELAARQKADPETCRQRQTLHGRVVGIFFEKASLRTRLSFETAVYQLGGHCIYMGPESGRIGERESIKDLAKVSSRYLDAFVLRTYKHDTIVQMAHYASKPVINGLSDLHHPCQALGDLLTIQEKCGRLQGVKVAFIGDCNNVCRSLAQSLPRVGASLSIASPQGYGFSGAFLKSAGVALFADPAEALQNADVVYTDVWASMGQESEAAHRRAIFQPYQISAELMAKAPKAIVMHCLPAHRGEEITDAVIDGPQSVVYDQAENRLHAQRALLCSLLD
ncbi:MAG: ornithine carbamoyltransferase [Planctomycetota bacterium]|nr:ornithine carbamoyltransferase [Planctomycetota bacterium]